MAGSNEQLKAYVKKEREKGFSDSQIKEMLLKSKHNSEQILQALKIESINKVNVNVNSKKHTILFLLVAILVIAILVIGYRYISTSEVPQEVKGEILPQVPERVLDPQGEEEFTSSGIMCLAAVRGNDTLCESIYSFDEDISKEAQEGIISDCKNLVNLKKIYNSDDSLGCEGLTGGFKDLCISVIDNTGCDTITDEFSKGVCDLNQNPTKASQECSTNCNALVGEDCVCDPYFTLKAMIDKNIYICDSLFDKSEGNIAFCKAMGTFDESICDEEEEINNSTQN